MFVLKNSDSRAKRAVGKWKYCGVTTEHDQEGRICCHLIT